MPNNLLQNILSDLRVDLTDHFDKNFSKGGFFGKKWKPRKDGVADIRRVRSSAQAYPRRKPLCALF